MSEPETVHTRSPGPQFLPRHGGEAAPNDRGRGGYLSDSQRSLTGDDFSGNESSQLIPSHGGPTSEPQPDTSLAQPTGTGASDAGVKRAASIYVNAGATFSGAESGPCPEPAPPPPVRQSPAARPDKTRLGSTTSVSARSSYKSSASQLPPPAGDDCCVHCILSCLFCELLTFCGPALEGSRFGPGPAGEACVGAHCAGDPREACGGGEDSWPCGLECGALEDCCGSADCLEICLECCSLCFAA
uniref:myoD family inhibitor domain-containing protein-like n=1 Tax=Pristiophorus japonicus TaxID=55135 RepID=UPI00398F390C